MKLSFGVEDIDDKGFANEILQQLLEHFITVLTKSKTEIYRRCRDEVEKSVRTSPEYVEMLPGGNLYGQIGVVEIATVLDGIINALKNEITVDITSPQVTADSIAVGLEINILKSDYSNILAVPGTQFISINRRGRESEVPWLHWLLFGVSGTLIMNYDYSDVLLVRVKREYSRTRRGLMIPSGEGFKFDFACEENDNWLTRALKNIEPEVVSIVKREIEANFG